MSVCFLAHSHRQLCLLLFLGGAIGGFQVYPPPCALQTTVNFLIYFRVCFVVVKFGRIWDLRKST